MLVNPIYVDVLNISCLINNICQYSSCSLLDFFYVLRSTVKYAPDGAAILNYWSYQRFVKSNKHVVVMLALEMTDAVCK